MSRMPHLPVMMPLERPIAPLFSLRFTTLAVGTVCLPLSSFLFCIVWSLLFNFTDTTQTHCKVPNYLPSISAAIGDVTPQRYVWRFCIGLHSAPRLIVAVAYKNFYTASGASYYCCLINFLLNVCEILCLLLLTYVSSKENHGIHKLGFSLFVVFSLAYMFLTLKIWRKTRRCSASVEVQRSYNYKKHLFLFTLLTSLLSMVFYILHNEYCKPGAYTIFALLEYLVVFSNMAFHMTAWWDFGSKELLICSPEEEKRI